MAVRTGLEVLLQEQTDILNGRKVGLIAHPPSVDKDLNHAVDLFQLQPEIRLRAVMGPQHGFKGETQDNMIEWSGYLDGRTGLQIFSLYGETRRPTEEMMSLVDVVVVDLQDVGARYYTYIHTLALVMDSCREFDKELIVLDRPNPIGGVRVEGTVLTQEFRSFVGLYPLAIRHGMTIGELAIYYNHEFSLECPLTVIEMEGWERDMSFPETELPWVQPSPNMPTVESALVYPGLCLLEGTNVSEGRGTTRPFEWSGAPWIDPRELALELDRLQLPGVRFRPLHFCPMFHKWSGHTIGGVEIHILDSLEFKPFLTGVAMVMLYRELGGLEFDWKSPPYEYEYELLPFDILCGTDRVRRQIESGANLAQIEKGWENELQRFKDVRKNYLLYSSEG